MKKVQKIFKKKKNRTSRLVAWKKEKQGEDKKIKGNVNGYYF